MLQLTGAQALVRCLKNEQIGFVFGIVGGKLAPLIHAIHEEPSIRFIGVRHEAAAPMMAAAIHAGAGECAVAIGEMGPGGLNLASGMGVAYNNNLPLLAITTNQHRAAAYPHSGMFMDMDTRAVFAPLTKWNAVVHDGRRLPELVRHAFREALSGRPGPVHLDIPQDVLSGKCSFADDEFDLLPQRYRPVFASRPAHEAITAAVALLREAKRPLLVAGGGVVASEAAALITTLAKRLGAPVVPTQMALGVIASDSPHFIGHGGLIAGEAIRHAFEQADVIVSVGCRFSSWMWDDKGALARRRHRVININIDPSALGHPVPHEVAMQADARLALIDLIDQIEALGEKFKPATETDWLARNRAVRQGYEAKLEALANDTHTSMPPAALARAIAAALPPDALAVYDGGHTTFWSNDFTPVHQVRTRFHDPGMSHLGFGLPYALALKARFAQRPVFNITGDGSFGFTLNELDSARRYGLNVITLIHNNESWGIIRSGQRAQLNFEMGTSLAGCDYAAIARGFGCYGEVVERAADVAGAIGRATESKQPAVIDCRTHFVAHPAGPMFGSMNRFGFDALAGQ